MVTIRVEFCLALEEEMVRNYLSYREGTDMHTRDRVFFLNYLKHNVKRLANFICIRDFWFSIVLVFFKGVGVFWWGFFFWGGGGYI